MTVEPAAVRAAAEKLLAQHGLTDWRFEWDNTKGRRGQTRYRGKTITYSMHYLASPPEAIVNTLLHEVSHALAGPGHGHDDHWRQIAISIGCTGERCSTGHIEPERRYTIRCKKCGATATRHRLDPRYHISNCRCGGHLEITDHQA